MQRWRLPPTQPAAAAGRGESKCRVLDAWPPRLIPGVGPWATGLLVAGYVVISSLSHYVLFPEPGPDPSDLPRSGTTIVNKRMRSKVVYRQTSIETAGELFEWDNFVESGGGPVDIPHVHRHMFLLDFHPETPGVFLATAGSGHGFKFGSVLGKIVLDRLDGIQSDRWTPQFSYDSFLSASSRPRLL